MRPQRLRDLVLGTSLAVVLGPALSGCGHGKLDSGKLEGELRSSIQRTTHVRLGAVHCPDDIRVGKGRRATCTANNPAGVRVSIDVTQSDAHGHVLYRVR